jgi:Bacterial RNA polymerase, alpha chain C terminal domain
LIELDDLIQLSRAAAANSPAGATAPHVNHNPPPGRTQHSFINPVSPITLATPETTRDPKSDHIFIPVDLRGIPLATVPAVSARLTNVLGYKGLKILGDIHGLRLSDFRRFRNCGKKTVLELEALVRGLQGGATSADLLQESAFNEPPPHPNVFSVAPFARDLNPLALPLSVRAENILTSLGVQHLGDLEGVTTSELMGVGNCGKKTVLEIQTLLQRARAREFDVTPEALQKTTSFDLLAQIDEMLRQLPKRDLELVTSRLAGSGQPPVALGAIAAQLNISRTRAWQIMHATLNKFVRRGGPKTKALLDGVAASCHNNVCPLTPHLLLKWAPNPWPLQYKPEFYVRAIAEMRRDIPAWPEGQKRTGVADERIRILPAGGGQEIAIARSL